MENSEALKEFSNKLKKTRKSNGIDLTQVFEITRIDKKFLKAIEAGNFDVMPDVYIRAFIREYSEAIGLNGEETLAEFNSLREGPVSKESEETEEIENQNKKNVKPEITFDSADEMEDKQLENNVIRFQDKRVLIGIVVFLSLVLIIYFAFLKEDSTELVKETPYHEVLSKQDTIAKINKENVNKTTINKNKSTDAKLMLIIKGIDTSWVRISADNNLKGEFVLYPGIKKEFPAKSHFNLLVGNSAGVELILNGKKLDVSGRKGRVRNLLITEDGIKYIRMKKKSVNGQ